MVHTARLRVPSSRGPRGVRSSSSPAAPSSWSPPTGTHGLLGPTYAKFVAVGGAPVLGYPTTEIGHSGVVDGTYDVFTGGAIFSSVNGGGTITHVLTHTAHHYLAIGGYGPKFGSPLSDEFPLGHTGGTEAVGTGGRLYWSAPTGAHLVYGEVLDRRADVFGVTGELGFPTADQGHLAWSSGFYEAFQHGDIFTSARWGAHVVRGPILREWQRSHSAHVDGLRCGHLGRGPGEPTGHRAALRARLHPPRSRDGSGVVLVQPSR